MPKMLLRSETFAGTSGPLDGTYTQQRTTQTVNYDGTGNAVASTLDQNVFAFDSSNVYQPDQYSVVRVGALSVGNDYNRATTRASGAGDANINNYSLLTSGDHVELMEWVAGVETALTDYVSTTVTSADLLELQSVGSAHTTLLNGIIVGTHTDATHTTGTAGFGLFNGTGGVTATMTDWEGGIITEGGPTRSRKLATQQRMVS